MPACSSCVIKGKGVTQEHVGRVLPMSMPKLEGHSANVVEIKEDSLERKLLSMSRGGSNNQRLLSPSQKKGLVPARGAAASLPAGASVQQLLFSFVFDFCRWWHPPTSAQKRVARGF